MNSRAFCPIFVALLANACGSSTTPPGQDAGLAEPATASVGGDIPPSWDGSAFNYAVVRSYYFEYEVVLQAQPMTCQDQANDRKVLLHFYHGMNLAQIPAVGHYAKPAVGPNPDGLAIGADLLNYGSPPTTTSQAAGVAIGGDLSIDVTASSATQFVGSFDLKWSDTKHLTGTFQATPCSDVPAQRDAGTRDR